MERLYTWEEGAFTLEGAISVERLVGCVTPWRIPEARRRLYDDMVDGTLNRAEVPSGVRLSFSTTAQTITAVLPRAAAGLRLDLCVGGEYRTTAQYDGPEGDTWRCTFELQPPAGRVELWLDPRQKTFVAGVEAGAEIRPAAQPPRRWVHYGSSISQSAAAHSPARIWAAIAARRAGLHLTNLGFGSNCLLSPLQGILIRDLPADLITMKLGINVFNKLDEKTFPAGAAGIISQVREKHPTTPITVFSPIYSPAWEGTRTADNFLTLEEMRAVLGKVVNTFRDYGDANIRYVSGLELMGEADAGCMPDGTHPDGDGQFTLAERMLPYLSK